MAGKRTEFPHAVFLDRDGTLIEDRDYLSDPAGVTLLPGVRDAIVQLREWGSRLYLFTNQSGVGRGYYTMEDVHRCNDRLVHLLGLGPSVFFGSCIAPEVDITPGGYRKPSPRYIDEVVVAEGYDRQHCWMVGDRRSDWQAGLSAGIRTVAVRSGKPLSGEDGVFTRENGVAVYPTLLEWVTLCFR